MKKLLAVLVTTVFLCSCENTWDSEIKDMFHQSCMEDAVPKAVSEKHAKIYCDCVLEKVMEKYPRYEDALTNIETIKADEEVQDCKDGNLKY